MIGAITAGLFSTGAAAGGGTAYESIATVTVGSGGQSTISFTSIPSTYKHLQVRAIMKSTTSGSGIDDLRIQANSDTAANYSFHYLWGWNGAANAGAGTSTTYMRVEAVIAQASSTNVFGAAIIDVLDYADTNKYKTFRTLAGEDNNGTATQCGVVLESGAWRSTSAINSLTLYSSANNLAQYSSFALYGIKG